uniref:Fucolectin tachylectin-4 pentraxin-1 domain-containing protein n=1 Tax=Sphaeramia orbicularis TaxID=375764 RepID=A0A673CCQ3_9TELE
MMNLSTLLQNVAINGMATQSSLNSSFGAPQKAIDGDRNHALTSGSCIQTNEQADPWWMVDLQRTYKIAAVIIGNREGTENNLHGGEIWISSSKDNNSTGRFRCGIITSFPPAATLYFPCRATEGRFVGVFLPGTRRVLSLCEVEVYSVDDAFPTPNVALRGEAAQSSTLSFAAAFKAIDGRRNSFYTKGSCSHTAEGETSPWWRVDLLRTFIITSIKVTNRGDCCAERLDGAEIRIGKSLHNNGNDNPRCATISHIRPGKTLTIHCDNGMMEGRYVNMVIPGNGKTLTLCEVEVYATPKGIAITDWITHSETNHLTFVHSLYFFFFCFNC